MADDEMIEGSLVIVPSDDKLALGFYEKGDKSKPATRLAPGDRVTVFEPATHRPTRKNVAVVAGSNESGNDGLLNHLEGIEHSELTDIVERRLPVGVIRGPNRTPG